MAGFSAKSRALALLGRSWFVALQPELTSSAARQQLLPAQLRGLATKATADESEAKVKKSSSGARAPSAYNFFQKDPAVRLLAKEAANSASLAAITGEISKAWKALSATDKQKYVEQAEAAKAAGASAKPAKKKLSAYNIYTKENLAAEKAKFPDLPQNEVFRKVAKGWSELSDSEKDVYKQKASSA